MAEGTHRRRSVPLLWVAGGLSAALLMLGVTGTLSAWTSAIITNSDNHVGTEGSVALTESGPDNAGSNTTCTTLSSATNAATCSTINKYGDGGIENLTLTPGDSTTGTSVTFTNSGAGNATSFAMAPGSCSAVYRTGSSAGGTPPAGSNLCEVLQVSVACTGDVTLNVGPVSLNSFAGSHAFSGGLASGGSTTCVFTESLPSTAGAKYSGQTASQPIVWTLAP